MTNHFDQLVSRESLSKAIPWLAFTSHNILLRILGPACCKCISGYTVCSSTVDHFHEGGCQELVASLWRFKSIHSCNLSPLFCIHVCIFRHLMMSLIYLVINRISCCCSQVLCTCTKEVLAATFSQNRL